MPTISCNEVVDDQGVRTYIIGDPAEEMIQRRNNTTVGIFDLSFRFGGGNVRNVVDPDGEIIERNDDQYHRVILDEETRAVRRGPLPTSADDIPPELGGVGMPIWNYNGLSTYGQLLSIPEPLLSRLVSNFYPTPSFMTINNFTDSRDFLVFGPSGLQYDRELANVEPFTLQCSQRDDVIMILTRNTFERRNKRYGLDTPLNALLEPRRNGNYSEGNVIYAQKKDGTALRLFEVESNRPSPGNGYKPGELFGPYYYRFLDPQTGDVYAMYYNGYEDERRLEVSNYRTHSVFGAPTVAYARNFAGLTMEFTVSRTVYRGLTILNQTSETFTVPDTGGDEVALNLSPFDVSGSTHFAAGGGGEFSGSSLRLPRPCVAAPFALDGGHQDWGGQYVPGWAVKIIDGSTGLPPVAP